MCAQHCAQLCVLAHLILKITLFHGYFHHHHHCHPIFPVRNSKYREVELHARGAMSGDLDSKPRQLVSRASAPRSTLLLLNC